MNKIKKWLERNWDKLAHFTACIVIFSILDILFGIATASLLTISIYIGKEIYDEYNGGVFDWKDIIADTLGLIFIIAYTLLIN